MCVYYTSYTRHSGFSIVYIVYVVVRQRKRIVLVENAGCCLLAPSQPMRRSVRFDWLPFYRVFKTNIIFICLANADHIVN